MLICINTDEEVGFSLPEAVKEGSVQLTFTHSSGLVDPNAPHIITFNATYETTDEHMLNLDGYSLGSAEGVVAVSAGPNDVLVCGAVYIVTISYQGLFNNSSAKDEVSDFVFDSNLTALLDIQHQQLAVHLNPTKGEINITLEGSIQGEQMDVTLINL